MESGRATTGVSVFVFGKQDARRTASLLLTSYHKYDHTDVRYNRSVGPLLLEAHDGVIAGKVPDLFSWRPNFDTLEEPENSRGYANV